MPPIKGKMMGRMGCSKVPSVSEFERVKSLSLTKKKARMHLSAPNHKVSNDVKDDKLMKLRYPPSIRQILPSVKKYKGGKNFVSVSDDSNSSHPSEGASETGWEERTASVILGTKKPFRGTSKPKYFVRAVNEEKFKGIIWDVAFSPSGDVVVSSAEGIFICGVDLRIKQKLDTVLLAGGISFMSDGRIVAVCRNQDTINVFSSDGEFLSSFKGDKSPVGVAVDKDDRLVVCDVGSKCVYIYDVDGNVQLTIGRKGPGFNFRWPLYASCHSDCSIRITDCHAQTVLLFEPDGTFSRDMKLSTYGCNQVLRPHGLCIHNNDVFVIDNATDSVEVFDDNDTFVQTLIPQEEGHSLRPKILSACDKYMAVGGLSGIVKMYKFIAGEELDIKPHHKTLKIPTKRKSTGRPPRTVPKIKIEIKNEIIVHDDDIDVFRLSAKKTKTNNCDSVVVTDKRLKDFGAEDIEAEDIEEEDVEDIEIGDSISQASYLTVEESAIKPTLLNTEDDPVVLDSDSEVEDEEEGSENESNNEEEENVASVEDEVVHEEEEEEDEVDNEEEEVMNSSFVQEHVDEQLLVISDELDSEDKIANESDEEMETANDEKLHVDEIIILDD